jgi:hypothetical protein
VTGWLLAVIALVAGGLISATWIFRVLGASINRVIFSSVVARLLGSNSPSRALKLAASAGEAPLAVATRAALNACRDGGVVASRAESDYRTGGADTREAVIARLRSAFDRGFDEAMTPIARARVFAPVGAAIACVAIAAPFILDDAAPASQIGAGGLLVLMLLVARIDFRFRGEAHSLFDSLSDALYDTALSPDRFEHETARPAVPIASAVKALTLTIYEPGRDVRTERVDRDIAKIGRLATAHVQLDSPSVARMHAVIERNAEGTRIIDLGTTAGTLVNGERVNKRDLHDGDVVTIGEAELRVGLGTR